MQDAPITTDKTRSARRALVMFLKMQDMHLPFRLLQICVLAVLAFYYWPGLWIPVWLVLTISIEVAGYAWSRRHLGETGSVVETQAKMQINDLIGHVILVLWVVPAFFMSAGGDMAGRYFAMLLLAGIAMAVSWQHGRLRHSALINAAIPGIAMFLIALFPALDVLLLIAAVLFSSNAFILTLAAQRSDDAMYRAQSAQEELLSEVMAARNEAERGRAESDIYARERADLLSLMSHEIRTPLNGIIALSDKLASEIGDETQQKYALAITESGRQLLMIVNDVLDQSRNNAGHQVLRPEWISRADFERDILAPWQVRAEAERIAFATAIDPDIPDQFLADPRRILQILNNLIGNAFKFAKDGTVRLSVTRLGNEQTPCLEFAVSDSGPGISAEDRDRIFERFERAGDETSSGTGLGLAISRNYARMMGGDIVVESILGRGATFRFHLPLIGRAVPSSAAVSRTRKNISDDAANMAGVSKRDGKLTILVADDNDINHAVIEAILSGIDAMLVRATNGAEAIELFEKSDRSFDLILMDVRMPKIDGLSAIRKIRAQERGAMVPIIALTANSDAESEESAYEAGADGWLAKPLDAHALIARVMALSGNMGDESSPRQRIARAG